MYAKQRITNERKNNKIRRKTNISSSDGAKRKQKPIQWDIVVSGVGMVWRDVVYKNSNTTGERVTLMGQQVVGHRLQCNLNKLLLPFGHWKYKYVYVLYAPEIASTTTVPSKNCGLTKTMLFY